MTKEAKQMKSFKIVRDSPGGLHDNKWKSALKWGCCFLKPLEGHPYTVGTGPAQVPWGLKLT